MATGRNISGITLTIGGDTTGLNKALKDVNKNITGTQEQLRDVERLLKLDPSNTELLAQRQQLLSKAVQDTRQKLETLKTAEQQAQQQFAEGRISQEQYDALRREIIDTEQQLGNLEDQARQANATLQQISVAGQRMQEFGGKVTDVGKKLSVVSAAVAGVGVASVKTAADFDESMSKVAAISGASGDEFDDLRNKAREMGAKTKFSAAEAADAMNYMAMAGWKTEDMMSGIEGIMNLAAASGEDLATTSDIVTDALTAFGLTAEDSGHFADVLAAASSNANTNVSMMGETFKYVASTAGAMGFSADEVAVAIGLMANSGIKGSQAGTQLNAALVNMVKPTNAMAAIMDKYDISITNADGSMKSFAEVMDMLRGNLRVTTEEEKANNYALAEQELLTTNLGAAIQAATGEQRKQLVEMGKGMEIYDQLSEKETKAAAKKILGIELTKKRKLSDEEYYNLVQGLGQESLRGITEAEQEKAAATLFGKEAMSGLLAVINATENDYDKLTNAVKNCDGVTQEMADTMQDNLNGQLEILKSQMQELAISIGDLLMPTIRSIVGVIQKLIDKFNGMSDWQKKVVVIVGLIIAALGPLLIIIGTLISSIGTIMTVIAGVSAPVLGVIAAIAALVGIFTTLYATNEEFRTAVQDIWSQVSEIISLAVELIQEIISIFVEKGKAIWEQYGTQITEVVSKAFEFIKTVIDTQLAFIKDLIHVIMAVINGDWSGAWEAMQTLIVHFNEGVGKILKALAELMKNVIKLAVEVVKNHFEKMKESAIEIFQAMKTAIAAKVDEVKNTIINGIQKAVDWIKALPSQAIEWGKDFMTGFADGIKSAIGGVTDAVKGVAENVSSFLHFSRPDTGPLREYEKWMPDMIKGMAKGLRANTWRLTDELKDITTRISVMANPELQKSSNTDLSKIEGLLDYYLPSMKGTSIVLDDGTLVGKMVPAIDTSLAGSRETKGRNGG